jgi:hypothetical protein
MVRVAVRVWGGRVAVMVALVVAVTLAVAMAKVAEEAPAGMRTEDGTVASGELLERVTRKPPVGAGPLSFTVPLAPVPPATEEGLSWSDVNTAGLICKLADLKLVPTAAVMPTTLWTVTGVVDTTKEAELDPAGTVTA